MLLTSGTVSATGKAEFTRSHGNNLELDSFKFYFYETHIKPYPDNVENRMRS
jgi:hypothetical protein